MKIALFLCILVSLHSSINQNNDVQLWIGDFIEKKIGSNLYCDISNQFRFGNNVSQLYFTYLQGKLGYRFSNTVLLAPGYRQIWTRSSSTSWSLVYEPLAELILRTRKGWARLDLRNRISYLLPERSECSWLWRGRLRWVVLEGAVRPYFSNELFIDSQIGFDQDRVALGILVPFVNHCRGDFYYMIRFLHRAEHVTHQHIFGLSVNAKF